MHTDSFTMSKIYTRLVVYLNCKKGKMLKRNLSDLW